MKRVWKRAVLLTGAFLAAFAVGACLLLGPILARGVSARDDPTRFETVVARLMRHYAIPKDGRGTKNPVAASAEVLDRARAHFADHCASCHGNDGSGQTTIGKNLYPKAPDMTGPATQRLSDGELFWIIKNGVRLTAMPAWGTDSAEDDRETWELVHLIRHFPTMTPEEMDAMNALNPRSREAWEAEQAEKEFLEGESHAPNTPSSHHPAH